MNQQELIRQAAALLFGTEKLQILDSASGKNNTTKKVLVNEESYILRLYNTHQDMEKVLFEHAVLTRLAAGAPALSFRVPEPVLGIQGATVVRLDNGKLAAAFRFIEGSTPDFSNLQQVRAYGAAAAQLTKRMQKLTGELPSSVTPAYPPYYQLAAAHEACPLPEAIAFCTHPPFEFMRLTKDLLLLAEKIRQVGTDVEGISHLPHQLIHGDLNASNALVREDCSIAALLDFEFATIDLQAMEPAVCLWGLVPDVMLDHDGTDQAETGVWRVMDAFWRGFCSRISLSAEELSVIPTLIQLRSLDVFLHFLGRYWEAVDDIQVLIELIPDTAARIRWIDKNRTKLAALLNHH